MNIQGKKVLITGASSGIGAATAIAFAKEGATVVIHYKSNQKAAEEVLAACNVHSQGHSIVGADITKEEEVKAMFETVRSAHGALHVLVNNAGIFDEGDSPTNLAAFDAVYRANFFSHVMVTKYALGLMTEGKIINVSSVHGKLGYGRGSAIAYSAFKAALDSYTKNLAKELAPKILVNGIAPGRVATPMWGSPDANEQKELGSVHLIQRMIQPEEVADSILFLARNDAMCGEILTIDGGMSLVTLG